ncbi:uncharacterized protein METZ01_LOCUS26075, partial [marine metagenome]
VGAGTRCLSVLPERRLVATSNDLLYLAQQRVASRRTGSEQAIRILSPSPSHRGG